MSRSLYGLWKRRRAASAELVSRREMLKATASSTAALLLAQCRSPSASDAAPPTASAASGRRIVVIGAGLAGLAAGTQLAAAGYDVLVLEARKRLGGRVFTLDDVVRGGLVDAGGELIGDNHPLWLALARRYGLELCSAEEPDDLELPVVLGGRRLARAETAALFEELDAACAAITAEAAAIDADAPWTCPDAATLDRRSTADRIAALSASEPCKALLAAELESNNGAPVERQSWLANLAQVKGGGLELYWTESERWRCTEGAQALARCLALELGRRRLRLHAIVRRLEHGADGVRVHLDSGVVLPADDVVLTAPPSTWRKIAFDPPLPRELAPQMGVAVKYLATMRRRFWRDGGLAADGVSDGPVGFTWDATLGQTTEEACLTAHSGGAAATECRAWSEADRPARYVEALETLFPEARAHFLRGRFVDWPADRWTLAGYSFPAPGEVTTVGPRLRAGVGALHFAGEHACPAFVGYMEGALQSGVAAARRLMARDGVARAG